MSESPQIGQMGGYVVPPLMRPYSEPKTATGSSMLDFVAQLERVHALAGDLYNRSSLLTHDLLGPNETCASLASPLTPSGGSTDGTLPRLKSIMTSVEQLLHNNLRLVQLLQEETKA